jgi:hypothetical protein
MPRFPFSLKQVAFLLLLSAPVWADSGSVAENAPIAETPAESAAAENADATPAIPLLPERLGPMEWLLWSERGGMRLFMPLTAEGREREMKVRRTMLSLHQLGGFATWAAMLGTVIVGQKVYNGKEDLSQIHKALAFTTVGAYFTTASLALFSPPPWIKRKQWSTVSTHRLLAVFHVSGMLAMPVLGTLVRREEPALGLTHRELRQAHLYTGYTTLAALGAAMLVVTF